MSRAIDPNRKFVPPAPPISQDAPGTLPYETPEPVRSRNWLARKRRYYWIEARNTAAVMPILIVGILMFLGVFGLVLARFIGFVYFMGR
jgi:hypothetical protein